MFRFLSFTLAYFIPIMLSPSFPSFIIGISFPPVALSLACSSPFSWHLLCFGGCLKVPDFDSAHWPSNSFGSMECSWSKSAPLNPLEMTLCGFLTIFDLRWALSLLCDPWSTFPREKIKSEQQRNWLVLLLPVTLYHYVAHPGHWSCHALVYLLFPNDLM